MRRSGETIALVLSVALIVGVFGYAIWVGRPQVKVWTVKVFEAKTSGHGTLILSYGSDYKAFLGTYNFTSGKTYRITYIESYNTRKLLNVEEVG